MIKPLFLLCCFYLLFMSNASSQVPRATVVEQGFIFDTASFKACHASTLVLLPGGTLLAAWFGGSYEGSPDVCIWLSRNKGTGWQTPALVAGGKSKDGTSYPCWNPVLFRAGNGMLYLHYKVGPNPREWQALYKTSADNGNTWSDAKPLPESFLGPIKNKPVQTKDGAILYPSSMESKDEKHWTVHLETSDAAAGNWKQTAIDCDSFQAIQPALLTYPHNAMQLLARSKENVIVQSWSRDGGRTWSRLSATSLPNPNSGIDAATIHPSAQVLVYNPLPPGKEWWEGRSVLKVAFSKDGMAWQDVYTLENESKGEFSYPAVVASPSGDVYITYTYDRKKIKFVHLRVSL